MRKLIIAAVIASLAGCSIRGLKSNGTKTYAKTIHPVPMGVSVAGVALS